ncbi:MAG: PEP-CTERM sorting domain-containing protein [Kiritimatiellae bacterium]|nr:PEP-CTERM sorting domain-containing protein [Kiritimatiellia bacterium]
MKYLIPLMTALFGIAKLGAAPLPVFMFDLGTGAVYDGNNSPAHAAGAVAMDNTEWIKAGGGGTHGFTDGTLTTNFGRSHNNALNAGIDFSLAAGNEQNASPGSGTGVFGTQLTETYYRGRRDGDGRNVGWAISGLAVGVYDVYVVLHNSDSLGSENNVGIGVLSDTPPTTSGTALPWNDSRLSQTSLPANPTTASWVAGENYAVTRVTVNNASDYLYVLGGAFGVNESAMSSIQIVAIPEPGTLALVGIALGSLLLFRRR